MTGLEFDLDIAIRLVSAVIAGGAIGFNRNISGKPTGIRSHALVALGAAVLMIAGMTFTDPSGPSRIIQGIIAGIGFIGGGVILRSIESRKVLHLNTAASLWVTTAIGIVCGIGDLMLAGLVTALSLSILVFGLFLDKWMHGWFKADSDE